MSEQLMCVVVECVCVCVRVCLSITIELFIISRQCAAYFRSLGLRVAARVADYE